MIMLPEHVDQPADLPPSIDRICPVMKLALSEARKTMASRAISSGRPARCIGTPAISPAFARLAASEAVQHAGLHRTRRNSINAHPEGSTPSSAADFVSPSTACLLAKVHGRARRALVAHRRGDVDDAALALAAASPASRASMPRIVPKTLVSNVAA